MRLFGLRVPIIVISFIIVFCAALGAGHLAYEQNVRSPLEDVLHSIPGVEEVSVEAAGMVRSVAPTQVRVRLHPNADLQRTYGAVERAMTESIGSRRTRLILEDRRSEELDDALRDMRFSVEEAMMTGAFRRMSDEMEAVGVSRGLDSVRVSMDHRFIYISLAKGDAYLHDVAARDAAAVAESLPFTIETGGVPGEVTSDG